MILYSNLIHRNRNSLNGVTDNEIYEILKSLFAVNAKEVNILENFLIGVDNFKNIRKKVKKLPFKELIEDVVDFYIEIMELNIHPVVENYVERSLNNILDNIQENLYGEFYNKLYYEKGLNLILDRNEYEELSE